MKNILVVNVNWIGDVVFSVPVFRALRNKYPDAKTTCLAVPRVVSVLKGIHDIDEIIVFDEDGKHRWPWGKLSLVDQLRRGKFDAAFLLHRSWTRAFLVKLAGIPIRVGYDDKKLGNLLTHKAEKKEGSHRSDHYSGVVESFGVKVENKHCILKVDPKAQSAADGLLLKNEIHPMEPFVIVNIGGNWDLKRWPLANFERLVQHLSNERNCKVVLSGSESDKKQASRIKEMFPCNVVDLSGQTDLPSLMALFHRAQVVISNDSGPVHLASAVGTDVIVLFGPTMPDITSPRGSSRSVILRKDVGCNRGACYHLSCLNNICMKAITVEDVVNAYQELTSQ